MRPEPAAYARRMRTDRGRQRFYAAGWIISAGVMVVASRIWRLHLREVEQRAEEAERTRDEVPGAGPGRAAAIARELHDSLTHSISVIRFRPAWRCTWPASAARSAARAAGDPGGERRRRPGTADHAQRAAQREDGDCSGLAQLDGLVARARAAGLPVTVTITGSERALPPEVDQAAYRIVQEALTNVSRHAGRASARLTCSYPPTP